MTREEAIKKLWEAATDHWYETDEETGEARPLGDLLFDSSTALPGMPIKGKELYEVGVALDLVEEVDPHGD